VHVGRQNRAVVALRRAVHDAVATAHHRVRVPSPRRTRPTLPVRAPRDAA
jgi:hypothetical protein